MTARILTVERVFHDFEGETYLRFTMFLTPIWWVAAYVSRRALEDRRVYMVLSAHRGFYKVELIDQYGETHYRSCQLKQWL